MDIDVKSAPKSVFKRATYYFCSEADKKTFDAAPEKFLPAAPPASAAAALSN
jgi:YHS domain-containing protein